MVEAVGVERALDGEPLDHRDRHGRERLGVVEVGRRRVEKLGVDAPEEAILVGEARGAPPGRAGPGAAARKAGDSRGRGPRRAPASRGSAACAAGLRPRRGPSRRAPPRDHGRRRRRARRSGPPCHRSSRTRARGWRPDSASIAAIVSSAKPRSARIVWAAARMRWAVGGSGRAGPSGGSAAMRRAPARPRPRCVRRPRRSRLAWRPRP